MRFKVSEISIDYPLIRVKSIRHILERKSVLFVTSLNDEQSINSSNISYQQIAVASFTDFERFMDRLSPEQRYDSIVLFPAHGHQLQPQIQWNEEAGDRSLLMDIITLALRYTDHVHLLACFSGLFLPDLLGQLSVEIVGPNSKTVTGYNNAIGIQDKYVSKYIFHCGLWYSETSYYDHWDLKSNCGCRGLLGAWSCISWNSKIY